MVYTKLTKEPLTINKVEFYAQTTGYIRQEGVSEIERFADQLTSDSGILGNITWCTFVNMINSLRCG